MTGKVLICIFLGIMGVEDMRTGRVALWKILLFLLAGGCISVLAERNAADICRGLLPGLFLLAAGKVSKGDVGCADGLVVLGIGMILGLMDVLTVLLTACLLTALAAGFLVVFWKKGRRFRIPFVPFLAAGMAGYLLWG